MVKKFEHKLNIKAKLLMGKGTFVLSNKAIVSLNSNTKLTISDYIKQSLSSTFIF